MKERTFVPSKKYPTESSKFRFVLAKEGLFVNFPVPPQFEPEILLYRAVIDQAIHDLGSKNPIVREEADMWFDPVNPDFLEVCDSADIDYRIVLSYIKENIQLISPPQ